MKQLLRLLLTLAAGACLSTAGGVTLPVLGGEQLDPLASDARAVVLLFTRSDCPISNRYAPELERLRARFAPQHVDFWLVFVDPKESEAAIREHIEAYSYHYGVLLDRRHELVRLAQVTVTPEAAVYVRGRLAYRGRVDNRYSSFGRSRQQATEHDLEQAVEAVLAGRNPQTATTKAIGCFIEDLK